MAVAPVFAGVMVLQAVLVAGYEMRGDRAREEVTKGYYNVCVLAFKFGFRLTQSFSYYRYPWYSSDRIRGVQFGILYVSAFILLSGGQS
jgi:hypothetical protein